MTKTIIVKLTTAEQNLAQKTRGSIGDARAKIALLKALGIPLENWDKPLGFIIQAGWHKLALKPDAKLLDRYILISGTAVEQIVWGWAWGYEAMTEEFSFGDKCVMPGEKLNDIALIKEEICKQLDCSYSSTVDQPVVNLGVKFRVGAPSKDQVTSRDDLISPKMRFAMYEIERYLKEESLLMKELTVLALEDKERRFTAAGKIKKESRV